MSVLHIHFVYSCCKSVLQVYIANRCHSDPPEVHRRQNKELLIDKKEYNAPLELTVCFFLFYKYYAPLVLRIKASDLPAASL